MTKILLALLVALPTFAQNVDRTFKLSNTATAPALQQLATTIRTVGDIKTVTVDPGAPALTVQGTTVQIAMAEWLVPRLDVAANTPGVQQYAIGGNPDDLLLVYGLTHPTNTIGVQEIITTFRTVADIQKIFNVTGPTIIALRGSSHEIALAKFLFSELDQPVQARQTATIHEYQVTPGGLDTVAVYGLAHTPNSRDIQVIITTLRTVLEIQKVYSVTAPKLIAIRYMTRIGRPSPDPGIIPVAEWLIGKLDRETAAATGNQMRMPGGNDDVLQVFYLTQTTGYPAVESLLTNVRTATHISRAYENTNPPALVLRATADTLALAGRTIAGLDQPPAH